MTFLETKENQEKLKSEVIKKMEGASTETLKELLKIMEGPRPYQYKNLTLQEMENKELRKKEIKISQDVLKLMKKKYKERSKFVAMDDEEKRIFSPEDPEIKNILERSDIIKRIGLKKRINYIYNVDIPWFKKGISRWYGLNYEKGDLVLYEKYSSGSSGD